MAGYIGMPAEKANSVAGIINFMRNIGSSVGTSMVTTLLARRAQVHQVVLSQHTTPFDPSLQNQVKALSLRLVHSGIERCRRAQAGLRAALPSYGRRK